MTQNALFELFGKRVMINGRQPLENEDRGLKRRLTGEEKMDIFNQLVAENPQNKYWIDKDNPSLSYVMCIKNFDTLAERIDKSVLWAEVTTDYKRAILRSDRTISEVKSFIDDLLSIEYDDGFGSQQLFGTVAYKDGSWRDRCEYDGSEWWGFYRFPKEPDWDCEYEPEV